MDLVTIITVVRNDKDKLRVTIKSIANQTYKNIEYIVIDGKSKDGTLNAIHEFDKVIDFWKSEPDNGIYDAMNKGIKIANGSWVNFLNAGDTFYDNYTLENIFKLPLYGDIIYGDFALNDIILTTPIVVKARSINSIFKGNVYSHQSCFVNRSILIKFPFNTKYKIAADYDQMMTFYKNKFVFQYFPVPVSIMLSNGLSYSNPKTYFEQMTIVFLSSRNMFKLIYFLPYLGLCLIRMFLGKKNSAIIRECKLKWIEKNQKIKV